MSSETLGARGGWRGERERLRFSVAIAMAAGPKRGTAHRAKTLHMARATVASMKSPSSRRGRDPGRASLGSRGPQWNNCASSAASSPRRSPASFLVEVSIGQKCEQRAQTRCLLCFLFRMGRRRRLASGGGDHVPKPTILNQSRPRKRKEMCSLSLAVLLLRPRAAALF